MGVSFKGFSPVGALSGGLAGPANLFSHANLANIIGGGQFTGNNSSDKKRSGAAASASGVDASNVQAALPNSSGAASTTTPTASNTVGALFDANKQNSTLLGG